MIDWPDSTRPFFNALTPEQQRGATLLYIANAAASAAFKSRYRRRWWGLLEERCRLAAMTNATLASWSSAMTLRLGGELARNVAHREAWQQAISAGGDGLVLQALDQDAPVLVAFLRAVSEARRDQWEADQALDRAIERPDDGPSQEVLL